MIRPFQTLLLVVLLPLFAGAAAAAPLEATTLYREKARDCRAVDLRTWTHPTRRVMESSRIEISKVELCNGGVYPVFTVSLPGDPMAGASDSYFNKLHARMGEANGWHSYALVDPARGEIVYVDVTGKRELSVNYDEFDAPKAK